MPDSMYDKLGELLSKALESGDFFSAQGKESKKEAEGREEVYKNRQNFQEQESPDKIPPDRTTDKVYKNRHGAKKDTSGARGASGKVIKYAQSEVRQALETLGVQENADYGEAKRQFHKKLMRFHPDKNADNETMRKITRERTGELLRAWKIVEEWYKGKE